MYDIVHDIWDLLQAVFSSWITLVSGVVSIFLTLWEKRQHPLGAFGYTAVLSLCLLPAVLSGWHDLESRVRGLNAENNRLRQLVSSSNSDAAVRDNTAATARSAKSIDEKADNFKRETSDNPQKELANLGVPWTDQGFSDALLRNDTRVVRLFVVAGFNPLAKAPEDGNALGLWIGIGDMRDIDKVREILGLCGNAKVNLLDNVAQFRGFPPASVPVTAARSCNFVLLREMFRRGISQDHVRDDYLRVFPGQDPWSPPDGQPNCQENGPLIIRTLGLRK